MERKLVERLPTFDNLVQYYGPYLSLVLVLVIAIIILQYIWYNKTLRAKNQEIERLANREEKLNDRCLKMINEEIGFRKKTK